MRGRGTHLIYIDMRECVKACWPSREVQSKSYHFAVMKAMRKYFVSFILSAERGVQRTTVDPGHVVPNERWRSKIWAVITLTSTYLPEREHKVPDRPGF